MGTKFGCRLGRTLGVLGIACASVSWFGCRKDQPQPVRRDATSATSPLAAGPDVIAMLDGLQVGDRMAGYEVTWIGSVGDDGIVEIRLTRGGRVMRLQAARWSVKPRPPARTKYYALYYERSDEPHSASEEDCRRVLDTLEQRIRRAERHAAPPAGLGTLPPPTIPM